jgi:DNA repair protein NreA
MEDKVKFQSYKDKQDKLNFLMNPKILDKTHFSGSTPPDIFFGSANYPNINYGILSPQEKGETSIMSLPEEWVGRDLSIEQIIQYRKQLVYAKNKDNIKKNRIRDLLQSLAMSSQPVSTEFFLSKKPSNMIEKSKFYPFMTNSAPLKKAIIEDNVKVKKVVDYIISDYDLKSVGGVKELYLGNIDTSHIQKIFSSGLLGLKKDRKIVPTKWAITAVDDIIGKEILEKIRYYKEIESFMVFSDYYNGNQFEIFFLPGSFEFEVMEVGFPRGIHEREISFCHDYESIFGRKSYATYVVGAYYADRLATTEYLEKVKRQGKIVVFHEEREEYYAPLGVGIIREAIRRAMKKQPEVFSTKEDALENIKSRLKLSFDKYLKKSIILNSYGKQKRIWEF